LSGRLKAILLLSFALLRTLLRLLFARRRRGIGAFRENYDADGLPPVSADERERMTRFGRCIACGLCDRGEAQRIAFSGGAYRGTMALVLAASRSMPDFRAAAYSFSFVPDEVLAEKESICPTGVPFRDIATFVRAKANAVGGPLPLPDRVASLAPRD
jgi:succinate dehydrogenase/fumarate reductase-like Fe-S protein